MAPPKASARPQTVPEYIAAADKQARPKLRELRKIIRKAAPGAVESLKWGMPAYSYKRILVMYAAFKHHLSFIPTTSVMRAFRKELSPFATSAAAVKFTYDQPLPAALIRRLTLARVQESLEKDGKWRTKS